jgi:hypothetical protein
MARIRICGLSSVLFKCFFLIKGKSKSPLLLNRFTNMHAELTKTYLNRSHINCRL